MSEARQAASLDEVPAGQLELVELDGTRIVLARLGDAVYACGDVCTHRGGPLSQGSSAGAGSPAVARLDVRRAHRPMPLPRPGRERAGLSGAGGPGRDLRGAAVITVKRLPSRTRSCC